MILETDEAYEDDKWNSFDNEALTIAAERANDKRIEELQRSIIKKEKSVVKDNEEKEMAPLMLFLSSSLNVEMVYTILHGISKFTLLNYMRNEFTAEQMKQFKEMEYKVDRFGDTTITIREIVIEKVKQWEKMDTTEICSSRQTSGLFESIDGNVRDTSVGRESGITSDLDLPENTIINSKTEITYHQLYEFGKLFEANQLSL